MKNKDPPHISELKREVSIWERTAQQLNVVSLEERAVRDALLSKAAQVRSQISLEENTSMQSAQEIWKENLEALESKYCITDYLLLAKSSVVLLVVILLFFLSNIIPKIELDLGKNSNITLTCTFLKKRLRSMLLVNTERSLFIYSSQVGLPSLEQLCC